MDLVLREVFEIAADLNPCVVHQPENRAVPARNVRYSRFNAGNVSYIKLNGVYLDSALVGGCFKGGCTKETR